MKEFAGTSLGFEQSAASVKENLAAGAKVATVLARKIMAPMIRRGDSANGQEEGILWTIAKGKPGTRRSRFVSRLMNNL